MKKKNEIPVKPWCPFCGMDVGRAQDAVQRKMTEFPVGNCECGAVYVCDSTGHNLGSAMVECLVYACGDEWDLAWELVPEDDYLTGRLEDYDDQTHQVIATKNIDGRAVRGVLYFVRLHRDIAEVTQGVKQKQGNATQTKEVDNQGGFKAQELEPERDPKRDRKKATKRDVKKFVELGDVDALVDLGLDDKKTLWFMQRLLYHPLEENRYKIAWLLGKVCARLSTRNPGAVADLLHRLFEATSDSAAASWGMVEAIGAIISGRPDIYGAFSRYLLNYIGDETTREQAVWALGEIANVRPDLIRKIQFYALFQFLEDSNPTMRGLTARLLGRIYAKEVSFQIMALQNDQEKILIFEQGEPVQTTVAEQAKLAVQQIHNSKHGDS